MSSNSLNVASVSRVRLQAASGGAVRPGESSQTNLTREVDFIAKTEDGAYSAAGFVKKEAKTIGGIAENVEKVSAVIGDDVDKVQTFVHQLHSTAESMEADVNQTTASLDGASRTEIVRKPDSDNDFLKFGWGWNLFRIFIVVLTFAVLLLQNMGNVNFKPVVHDSAGQDTGGSSKASVFTTFNMLLLNLGPILRVLSFVKSIVTREEKIFAQVEETVDEAAGDVKKIVMEVASLAHVVEDASKKLEKQSEQVQTGIDKDKVTSTTKKVT